MDPSATPRQAALATSAPSPGLIGLPAALASGAVLGALAGAVTGTLVFDLAHVLVAHTTTAMGVGACIGGLCGTAVALVGWAALRARTPSAQAIEAPPIATPSPQTAGDAPARSAQAPITQPDLSGGPDAMASDFRPLLPVLADPPAQGLAGSGSEVLPEPHLERPSFEVPFSFERPADIRDALTGAYTQRYFIAAADREWSRIRRHGEDAALLMIDVDHLRRINDTHGRACGDAVLVQMTRLAMGTLRQYDLMARFNAGVLVVYLPQTDPIGAIDVAERIRERIHNFHMNWPTGTVTATVSVGVASIGADHVELDQVIGDAGAALRAAKLAGRNCVRAAPVPPKRNPMATLGDKPTPGMH